MFDLVIFSLVFGLGCYFCSIELHRRFIGTWVETLFLGRAGGEMFRLFCFSLGCKLSLAAVLLPFAFFWVVL